MRQQPRPFIYALLVHLVLLAVLVFSLDWTSTVKPSTSRRHAPIQAVAVDARQLDAELRRKQQLEEQKRLDEQEKLKRLEEQKETERKKVEEQKRQAELKRKQEQEAKRKAEAEKKRQSELALKKKAEAEKKRREEEARKKAEAEKKRKEEEERKKAEAEKKRKEEEERKKAEAEQKRKQEEARKKAEQELQARLAAEQAREAAQRQSAMQRMVDEYVLYIQEKVQRSWIRPPSSGSELSCTVEVRLIPSGEVIDAQIVRSSGNSAFDRSVEAAVFKASPLPVPPDPDVMEQFRSLRFEFKPGAA
jgi:colicin import membrane protein